jgi:hypothetical protein
MRRSWLDFVHFAPGIRPRSCMQDCGFVVALHVPYMYFKLRAINFEVSADWCPEPRNGAAECGPDQVAPRARGGVAVAATAAVARVARLSLSQPQTFCLARRGGPRVQLRGEGADLHNGLRGHPGATLSTEPLQGARGSPGMVHQDRGLLAAQPPRPPSPVAVVRRRAVQPTLPQLLRLGVAQRAGLLPERRGRNLDVDLPQHRHDG